MANDCSAAAAAGIVTVDSETLKQWGRSTFIVVAARRAFLQAHPDWVQRISRIKMLLDESWLLSESVWQVSGQRTGYIASVGHLADLNVSNVQGQLVVHRYISERSFSSTVKQLSCEKFAHPSHTCGSTQHGTANAIAATANFFLSQKGLATPAPTGKWVTAAMDKATANSSHGSNPWFASLIDSSIIYSNSRGLDLSTVMADLAAQVALASPAPTTVVPARRSIEAGSCVDYNLAVNAARLRQLGGGIYTIDRPFMLPANDTEQTGIVTDKGSMAASLTGASYRDRLHCLWGVKAKPVGSSGATQFLLLNFTSLRVWSGDVVRVYETSTLHKAAGGLSGAGQLIAQLSGIDHSWPALRSSRDVLVEFKTDSNAETCYNLPEGDGWTLAYNRADTGCASDADCSHHGHCSAGRCDCVSGWGGADCSHPSCLGTISVSSTAGTFRSSVHALKSTHLYPNNAECIFVTRGSVGDVVELTIELDLEETWDFLEVRAGQSSAANKLHAKLSGHAKRTIIVPTDAAGDASLRFTTDNKGRRSGFIATFLRRQKLSSAPCAHLNNCGVSPHSRCVKGRCVCGAGWAGVDCSSNTCTPQPVLLMGNESEAGVIRSGTAGLMPQLATCEWQISAGQRNEISGLRLYLTSPGCRYGACARDNCDCSAVNRTVRAGLHPSSPARRIGLIDIEPSKRGSGGDFVTIQPAGLRLSLQSCTRNEECSDSWQSGVCESHHNGGTNVCGFKQSIDVAITQSSAFVPLPWVVSLSTDRNDGIGSAFTGVSLGWELIHACPPKQRWTNQDAGPGMEFQCPLGSCECELAGGNCSDTGACTLANQAFSCGCGGALMRSATGATGGDSSLEWWMWLVISVGAALVVLVASFVMWARWRHKRRNGHLLLKRYRIDGTVFRGWCSTEYHGEEDPPVHKSRTSEVKFARDTLNSKEHVCIKQMINKDQFEKELISRYAFGNGDAVHQVPSDAVISVKGWHGPHDYLFPIGNKARQHGHTTDKIYKYLLVMESGDRSLHEVCMKERVAGVDLAQIKAIARGVAKCLLLLHDVEVVHGDLKPRNILRHERGPEGWLLCDMDATALVGDPIGDRTSSGYCPPELAVQKYHLRVISIPTEILR
jgi:hypothetical protein